MATTHRKRAMRVRTLFLSDVHLGFARSRAAELAEFLRGIEAETILLVGDIVDALSLSQRFFWSDTHTQVVRLLLAKRRAGARLIYVPGNHDAALGVAAEVLSEQIEVHRQWTHRTADGRHLLVLHGDQFDEHVEVSPWLARVGDVLYGVTLALNDQLNGVRRALGMPYWSLAEVLKLGVSTSARYIERFEAAAIRHAQLHGYDGVVCGHIHRPNLRLAGGTMYCNTGDWVDSCSALIEDVTGELHLLRWPAGLAAAPAVGARL